MNVTGTLKTLRQALATAAVAALALPCFGISIADPGTYQPNSGEIAPPDMAANIKIIPPPTGGDLRVTVRTDRPQYHVGDSLRILFSVNHDSYVYIFDTDAAGMTRQVFPNYFDRQNFIRQGRTYYIPDRAYDLEVTLPSGRETLTIVAVSQDFPFLSDYNSFSRRDPYPASRDGAAGLVRRIESFRAEPPSTEIRAVRPVPRRNFWAQDETTFYVMGRGIHPPDYRVPRYGMLDVDTHPNNARIYIDSEYYGRTPQVIERLEPGYHHVHLEKEGYLPYDTDVYINTNQTRQLDIFLKETPIRPGYSRGDKPDDNDFGFFSRQPESQQPAPRPSPPPVMDTAPNEK